MTYYKKDLPKTQNREDLFFRKLGNHGIHLQDYTIDKKTHSANRLVTMGFVIELTGLKKGQITQMIGKGKFPRGIKMKKNRTVWPEMEIFKWLQTKKEEIKDGI